MAKRLRFVPIGTRRTNAKNTSHVKVERLCSLVGIFCRGVRLSALQAIAKWLADPSAKQSFYLGGFAGSGKTTLAKHFAAGINSVCFAAFTGKASLVMRRKGCTGASTIHSLIYIAERDRGVFKFSLNPESAAKTADLVIIDEVSMVSEDLAVDLLSFGTKVLVLGDPAQLPPVDGAGYFTSRKPDCMLTEIHRQAAESPIIRMSMDVREGRKLRLGAYGTGGAVKVVSQAHFDWQTALDASQALCGLNRTRKQYNQRMRKLRGLPETVEVGDKLICLKNARERGLMNGGLWRQLIVNSIATDRYTFAFLCPPANVKAILSNYRIPAGCVKGWDATDVGVKAMEQATSQGITEFTTARAAGKTKVEKFFIDARKLDGSLKDLVDVTAACKVLHVDREAILQPFVEENKLPFIVGANYYSLTKPETLRPNRAILVRQKGGKQVYSGPNVRKVLGLPNDKECKVEPGDMGTYELFLESTSHNRVLVRGTDLIVRLDHQGSEHTWAVPQPTATGAPSGSVKN